MKIAYLTENNVCINSGINSKISFQINEWTKEGCDVKIFSIHSIENINDINYNPVIDGNVEVFYNDFLKIFRNTQVINYLNKIINFNTIRKKLFAFKPDIIYYRQGIWFPGLTSLLQKIAPTVLEINTLDIYEMRHYNFIRKMIYGFGRKKIIDSVKGLVAVSNEIASFYKKYNKPSVVIGNGYDFSNISLPNKIKSNETPNLIFVGTPNLPWQGEEKIILLAQEIPEFDFHIVGFSLKSESQKNIISHGFLSHDSLFKLYQKMDVGIGTLALHRKNMNEASPLKTREYAAFGLPMIIGYDDTDLKSLESILQLGNYEKNVLDNIEKIRSFVNHWKNKAIDFSLYFNLLNQNTKEKKRLEFFKKIKDEI